jgi:DnaK suppressor protein
VSDSSCDEAFPAIDRAAVSERLAAERADTVARIAGLERDVTEIIEANALVAVDDEHDPEGSSTAFERAHTTALLARAQDHLTDLDRALARLAHGTYGHCEHCGTPIPPARLEARPSATTCVHCAGLRRR